MQTEQEDCIKYDPTQIKADAISKQQAVFILQNTRKDKLFNDYLGTSCFTGASAPSS